MGKVLVKRGANGDVYHKDNGEGVPPCTVDSGDPDDWHHWSEGKAAAWKTPCQNPDCWGDSPDGATGVSGADIVTYPH